MDLDNLNNKFKALLENVPIEMKDKLWDKIINSEIYGEIVKASKISRVEYTRRFDRHFEPSP